MAHLDLSGVSADGRCLLLVDRHGEKFTLEITPALRAALRGETTRSAVLENQMTSTLRPREIQTRIRAGETAEAVATAAGTTVDAIMPYAGPVLAERAHIAQRAQKSSLRRPAGDAGAGTRALGDAVSGHLSTVGAKADDVEWDASRRDDGRWEVAGTFDAGQRSGIARFTFDAPGNYVVADNDDARWLVGDLVEDAAEARRDDLQEARQRRLAAVSAEELPLGDDALDLVTGEAAEMLVEAPAPTSYDDPLRDTTADVATDPEAEPAEPAAADVSKHRRPVAKKRGRASVPTWDEIMFGGGDQ